MCLIQNLAHACVKANAHDWRKASVAASGKRTQNLQERRSLRRAYSIEVRRKRAAESLADSFQI